MTGNVKDNAVPAAMLDRSDERVKHEAGIGGAVRAFIDRVRSKDRKSVV